MNSNVSNAYESYGTSYLVQYASNSFAVESVTHDAAAFLKRVSEWQAPSKKIILGDWVWHGNRKIENSKTRWHDTRKRKFNMLFSDGHVKYYGFPLAMEGWQGKAPNPNDEFY
ncbi:MAG: hypothetical protein NE334_05945 [Lentisphaeraceae bacterium]|nr:hypothetical protein [Lentisphaeraceae bacterium]